MTQLDGILEVSDKHACFNCTHDDVDIPKQQIKDLMREIIGDDLRVLDASLLHVSLSAEQVRAVNASKKFMREKVNAL